jgi:hypothetical protein
MDLVRSGKPFFLFLFYFLFSNSFLNSNLNSIWFADVSIYFNYIKIYQILVNIIMIHIRRFVWVLIY